MRKAVLLRIINRLLWFTTIMLCVPLTLSAIELERTWYAWFAPAVLSTGLAIASGRLYDPAETKDAGLRRREGLIAVTISWLVLVLFTAMGYYLTFELDSFSEAFFESMSGFTTTGATVATDIEALPRSMLLMRSVSHWIGGMGIIVLSVAILPELAVGGMQLIDAESSGFESEKLAPRIAGTARRLWGLYFGITLLQSVLLWLGDMTPFDAANHAMSTIATGGFSTKNASIAAFDSVYIEAVTIVFMFISGMSFVLLYSTFIQRRHKKLFSSPEVQLYAAITVVAIVVVTISLLAGGNYVDPVRAFRDAAFSVVSIITTTGFGTADFDVWPPFAQLVLVILMIIGGCAGSTAGGSKVVRMYIIAKHALLQLNRLIRPRIVIPLQLGGRNVSRDAIESVLGFYLLYFAATAGGALFMTASGMDLISGTTATISAMNSIGPGLGTVGPIRNFAHIGDVSLYGLSFCMLLGRLEIYTVLVLFAPRFWRRL